MAENVIYNQKIINIATTVGAATATVNTSAVDTQGWDGVCFIGRWAAAATTSSIKAANSTASGGTYTDLVGTKILNKTHWRLDIYRPRERFNRIEYHRGSAAFGDTWAILYNGRANVPATDNVGEFHASPTEGTA